MNKICLLPPEISQKIAAGEVIERPFSVVKELVENSLDAGASEIKIELREGGKKLICVRDNGCGMSRGDALMAFERHATSKIGREEDLFRISTLGFRGEALASIAAVSRVILKTFDEKEGNGTLVEREGEKVLRVEDIAFPRGTSVEVRDLFFNLPVRHKFLRSAQAELTVIAKYLTHIALAYPEVNFLLVQGKRELINCPAVKSFRERIFQLFGASILERTLELDWRQGGNRLFGFCSSPLCGRLDREHQGFFVNRRPVKDRIIPAALNQAYKGFLEKDHFPEAFLFLAIPFEEVDVNVHPAKAEVRFQNPQAIFHLVLQGIGQALGKEREGKTIEIAMPISREKEMTGVREEKERFEEPPLFISETRRAGERIRVLGQFLETYVIALKEEEVFIIDQHNAHERVLFERYREIDREKKWPRRAPLFPLLFDLSPSQVLNLEENQAILEEAGFSLENMGGRTFSLKAFPDLFQEEEAKEVLLSLLEEIKGEKAEWKKEKFLATLACKTAIKAGESLPLQKMEYLVEELFQTGQPYLCPHGRPTLIKIEKKDIERGLKRPTN